MINKHQLLSNLVWLNVLGISLYFFIAIECDLFRHTDELVFSSPDSRTYRDVADWLFDRALPVPFATAIRPFFYPFILGVIRHLSDSAYAVWLVQFILWILGANLLAWNAYLITKHIVPMILVFIVYVTNVSLIAITFHALTETVIVFILSIWIYMYVKCDLCKWHVSLFLTLLLSLATVTKPIYQTHLAIFTLYLLVKNRKNPGVLASVLVGLFPVMIQLAMMWQLYRSFTISQIGNITFREYYLAAVYAQVNQLTIGAAREIIQQYTSRQIFQYLLAHRNEAVSTYLKTVFIENLTQFTSFISSPLVIVYYSLATNILYTILHAICIVPVVKVSLKYEQKRILVLYFFALLTVASAGISFWQGDRLVLIALPFWLIAYAWSLDYFKKPNHKIPVTAQGSVFSPQRYKDTK